MNRGLIVLIGIVVTTSATLAGRPGSDRVDEVCSDLTPLWAYSEQLGRSGRIELRSVGCYQERTLPDEIDCWTVGECEELIGEKCETATGEETVNHISIRRESVQGEKTDTCSGKCARTGLSIAVVCSKAPPEEIPKPKPVAGGAR